MPSLKSGTNFALKLYNQQSASSEQRDIIEYLVESGTPDGFCADKFACGRSDWMVIRNYLNRLSIRLGTDQDSNANLEFEKLSFVMTTRCSKKSAKLSQIDPVFAFESPSNPLLLTG